tara:strand:+ start:62 stop:1090 length:1029 start_codon:yes stop_codon:yes gene_type:complete
MKESIIIYKDKISNKNNIPKNVLLIDHDNISNLYNCRIVNPPFFKNIFIINDGLTDDQLKKISNMCLVDGKIHFIPKYQSFFKNKKNIYVKKENTLYSFPHKRIIDFIIMGVQRGGTTSLSQNLSNHPDIYLDKNKNPEIAEVHFFDLNWQKGIQWYKKQFNYKYKLVGEKTPDLINLDYTFPLIQSVNPYVKLIVVLRNPIERAYSAWKLNVKRDEKRTFQKAIEYEIEHKKDENKTFFTIATNYLQRGLYFKQIETLLKWFPKQNILILLSHHIQENPQNEYNKIYTFLNIPPTKQNFTIEHQSEDTSKINKKLYNNLIKYYKEDVNNLEKLLNLKTNWF